MALRSVHTHHISARAKALERFAAKASKTHPDDPTRPKYTEPLKEIEDLAAARVITYVLRALPAVERVVEREFRVVERSDKSDQLLEKAQVGYRSIHLIVEMKLERAGLLEYQEFAGLRAEVQIRTILQHAWAEIEHDMRYKPSAEPNRVLSQRFTALAGLIEVGDREFEQIYEIDERRRKDLVDLAQINEAVSPPAESGRELSEISRSQPMRSESIDIQPRDLISSRLDEVQPRDLISRGLYTDAIARYNGLIQHEPRQFGHFLGRAKARFLSGDAQGALTDIATAESLSPGNRLIARVRDLIEGPSHQEARPGGDQTLALRTGHTALRDGDPERALQNYSEAEALGFSPVFSVFNRAMALFLARNYAESQRTLDQIDPYPQSHLRLNVVILRTLCYLMTSGDNPDAAVDWVATSLQDSKAYTRFNYNTRSPLQDLEIGIKKSFDPAEQATVAPVFDLLRRFDSSSSASASVAPATPASSSGVTLVDLARRAEDTGDVGGAYQLFQESLSVSEAEGQTHGVMRAASNLGRLAKRQGDSQASIGFFRRAGEAARLLGRVPDEAWNLGNIPPCQDS